MPSTARPAVPLRQPRADTVKAPGRRTGVGDGKRDPGTGKVGRQDAPRPRCQVVAILHVIKVAGQVYHMQYRDDMAAGPWNILATNLASSGAALSVTDTNPAARRFYRVGAWLP